MSNFNKVLQNLAQHFGYMFTQPELAANELSQRVSIKAAKRTTQFITELLADYATQRNLPEYLIEQSFENLLEDIHLTKPHLLRGFSRKKKTYNRFIKGFFFVVYKDANDQKSVLFELLDKHLILYSKTTPKSLHSQPHPANPKTDVNNIAQQLWGKKWTQVFDTQLLGKSYSCTLRIKPKNDVEKVSMGHGNTKLEAENAAATQMLTQLQEEFSTATT